VADSLFADYPHIKQFRTGSANLRSWGTGGVPQERRNGRPPRPSPTCAP